MRSEDAELWHEAIQELTSLYCDRKCWEYVPYPPKGTQLLNAHFICKKKLRLGKVLRRKALLVIGGHMQEAEID